MSEFVQITTTTGTREVAERIATELVSRRLAACVQVGGPIQSTFRWQDKLETTEEWFCLAKTERGQLNAIERLLAELHPYEVPELVATPIVAGGAAYLKWMAEQIGEGQ
ncbi:MAG: divalent-cation tolerance protein CutA [Pirellulales bacterium]